MGAPFYASKTWWMAILGVVIPLLNQFLGWNMDPQEVLILVLPIVGYIIGEKYKDAQVQTQVVSENGWIERDKVNADRYALYQPQQIAPKE